MNLKPDSPLRDALRSRNSTLLTSVETLVDRVTPLLWHTIATFPTGTSHTPEHTYAVERNAGMLLAELIDELNDDELAIVILGCHFHDLGMSGTERENADESTREQARRDHAVRIGDRIREKWQEFGFSEQSQAVALAEVCRGHRPRKAGGRANWDDIREQAILGPGRTIRLRLVSALIYAADELHIGADRAPVLEQEWLRLQNDESRRHWKRHQCVHGPNLNLGTLSFEVHVSTSVLERDLRKGFLSKSFEAVRDAQTQMRHSGIAGALPGLKLTWVRDDSWRLTLLKVVSDMSPKTRDQIASAICDDYKREREDFLSLSELCEESAEASDDTRVSILRVVDHFISRAFLIPSGESNETYVLETSLANNHQFSQITHSADETDVLFAGRYASHHEFDLHRSAYGEAFAHNSLTLLIANSFGVDLATEQEDLAVRTVLGMSPTAARIVIDFPPAPSILVKRYLLRLCALTGASLDLLRCPELLLRKDFRLAIRQLATTVSANQLGFLRFIEELALLDGYNFQQIWEALSHSDEELTELKKAVCIENNALPNNETGFRITQNIPLNLKPSAVSLAHLYVASQRTQTKIELVNTVEAPLEVTPIRSGSEVVEAEPIVKLSFGPAARSVPSRIDRRTDLTIDMAARTMDLAIQGFGDPIDMTLPIIAHFAVSDIMNHRTTTTVSYSFYVPALTAKHLHDIMQIQQMAESGNIEVRMVGGPGVAATSIDKELASQWKLNGVDQTVAENLLEFGPDTPYPWHFPRNEFRKLASPDVQVRQAVYEKYRTKDSSLHSDVMTVTLRYANENEQEYREEFLCFCPCLRLRAKSDEMSEADFEKWWQEGSVEAKLAMSFATDMHDLAREIRDWSKDSSQPFPLKTSSDPPSSPIFKTRAEIIWCAKVDRLWYVERPLIVRLRPINDVEKWNVEGMYWESIGDNLRSEILRERLAENAPPQEPPDNESSEPNNLAC